MRARTRRWPWVLAGLAALLAGAWLLLRTPDIPAAELRAKYALPASEFVEVAPGFRVHLVDEGPPEAPALVLLHGSNASLHTWRPWSERLRDTYRIVTLDLQGHGLTGAHPQGGYTPDAMVRTVEAVARAKNLPRFALGGNSMGGGVAWRYALAHPERVSALILVDAGGLPARNPDDIDLPIGFRIARTPLLRDVFRGITPRALVATSLEQSMSVRSVITPAMVDRYWELLRHPGNREATMARFAMPFPTDDPTARLRTIAAPTLVMWGREDRLIPLDVGERLAAAIPNARLVVFDGVGHIPMEELPDRSAAAVRAFLDGAFKRSPPTSSAAPQDRPASAAAPAPSG